MTFYRVDRSKAGRRVVTAAMAVVLACGLSLSARADTVWQWSNPQPQGHQLNAAADNSTQRIAVGHRGTILGSGNGSHWTARRSPTQANLKDVLWADDRFLAVGTRGTLLSSSNGFDWTLIASGVTRDLSAIAWNGTRFVVIGGERLLTSLNAVTWQDLAIATQLLPYTPRFSDVVWTGQQFVLLGGDGEVGAPKAAVSADGLTWTVHDIPGGPMQTSALAWNGSHLVAAGNDPFEAGQSYLMRSSDGIAWTTAISPLYMVFDVTGGGGQFLIAGGGGGNSPLPGTVYTSVDGVDWTPRSIDFRYSVLGARWTGAEYVLVGEGGYIATSPNAQTWEERSRNVYRGTLYGLRWLGDEFVATSYRGTLLTSPDGRHFTQRSLGSNGSFNDIARAQTAVGERWVAVGFDGAIQVSANRNDWMPAVSGSSAILDSIAWGNGRFVVVGTGGTILTSSDGVTWSPQSAGIVANFHSVVFTGQQFVAAGASILGAGGTFDAGLIFTSPNGVQWTQRYRDELVYPGRLCWTGTRVVAAAGRHVLMSSDGIDWTAHPIASLGADESAYMIAWDGRRFMAVGEGVAATSVDGLSWTRETLPIPFPRNFASDGRQFLVVSSVGTILRTGDDLFADGWE